MNLEDLRRWRDSGLIESLNKEMAMKKAVQTSGKTPNTLLKELMKKHSLTRRQVAELCMVNNSTVDRWLVPATVLGSVNPTFRKMPGARLSLLQYKLSDSALALKAIITTS